MKLEKITELPVFPKTADMAELLFVEKNKDSSHSREGRKRAARPTRIDSRITIPFDQHTEIMPLQGGRQFAVKTAYWTYCGNSDIRWWVSERAIESGHLAYKDDYRIATEIWLGGTDELPFLSRLTITDVVETWSEEDFYRALKPEVIRNLECFLGQTVKRQGDLYAYPLEMSWATLVREYLSIPAAVKQASLHRTRHALTGFLLVSDRVFDGHTIVTGFIEAPDHKRLVLEGLHLIAFTPKPEREPELRNDD